MASAKSQGGGGCWLHLVLVTNVEAPPLCPGPLGTASIAVVSPAAAAIFAAHKHERVVGPSATGETTTTAATTVVVATGDRSLALPLSASVPGALPSAGTTSRSAGAGGAVGPAGRQSTSAAAAAAAAGIDSAAAATTPPSLCSSCSCGGLERADPRRVGLLVVGKQVEAARVRLHREDVPVEVARRVAGAAQDALPRALVHRLHRRRPVVLLRLLARPAETAAAPPEPEEEVLNGNCEVCTCGESRERVSIQSVPPSRSGPTH